ncbi:hypothetical protein CLF_109987 [Clonorchis sinensis]|uniref:Uncharacterized protein n=1 Tax=Clonorchis sinensis TaxID=79923 RepID=G7YK33_CLOSI|nr:hypothetical protein CLF_109987 [Clonorchis sinensis]
MATFKRQVQEFEMNVTWRQLGPDEKHYSYLQSMERAGERVRSRVGGEQLWTPQSSGRWTGTFRTDLQILYGTYVRPLLEYANPVVYSGRTKDATLIERVQRAATKMVAGLKSMHYETRPRCLTSLLEYRRLRGDLILTYALFEQGLANRFFTVDPAKTRRGHDGAAADWGSEIKSILKRGNFVFNPSAEGKPTFIFSEKSGVLLNPAPVSSTDESVLFSCDRDVASGASANSHARCSRCSTLNWPVALANRNWAISAGSAPSTNLSESNFWRETSSSPGKPHLTTAAGWRKTRSRHIQAVLTPAIGERMFPFTRFSEGRLVLERALVHQSPVTSASYNHLPECRHHIASWVKEDNGITLWSLTSNTQATSQMVDFRTSFIFRSSHPTPRSGNRKIGGHPRIDSLKAARSADEKIPLTLEEMKSEEVRTLIVRAQNICNSGLDDAKWFGLYGDVTGTKEVGQGDRIIPIALVITLLRRATHTIEVHCGIRSRLPGPHLLCGVASPKRIICVVLTWRRYRVKIGHFYCQHFSCGYQRMRFARDHTHRDA